MQAQLIATLPGTLRAMLACLALAAASAWAQDPLDGPETADYDLIEHWLCRPDALAACATDLETTQIAADGTLTREPFSPARDPEIDCFYVYPSVSLDPGPNSDLVAGTEEQRVIGAQFARFSAVCRPFAPLYRQVTLAALRSAMAGQPLAADPELAYADIRAAFEHYLLYDNQGRGFVLIGHSQGSNLLARLIAEEIDGLPIARQLVSALLIGTAAVMVPPDADTGGTFRRIPLCRAPDQVGCIVSYAAFRRELPPPDDSRFGHPRNGEPLLTACNHPAALAGGRAELDGYLSSAGVGSSVGATEPAWVSNGASIDTPFVRVPGLLAGECVRDDRGYQYLAVDVRGDPSDPRTDDIAGDVVQEGTVVAGWGLHLVDLQLAQGSLIRLVEQQTAAYLQH